MATDHLSFLYPKLKEDDIMATPKKLPSGQWRTQVYDYTDEGGKRHYRSFTASTKKMSALMAAEFAAHRQRLANGDLTIGEAVDHYIDSKQNILSPSTVRGYVGIRKNNLASIENMSVRIDTAKSISSRGGQFEGIVFWCTVCMDKDCSVSCIGDSLRCREVI